MDRTLLALALSLLALPLVACEAVPDVIYRDEDAATVDGGSQPDSAPTVDSGAVGCPTAPPPGATACCGTIPCSGQCDAVGCGRCTVDCPGAVLCCGKKQNAICRSALTDVCPP